jgi:glycerol uptake facilitator-like aquaporin
VFSDFTDTAVKARKINLDKRIDCQLIVYSLKIIFSSFFHFLPAASIFSALFKRFTIFALVESTVASTLAAAVSTAHFCFYFGSVFYFVVSFFLQETSTKVATRANPKMLSSCFVF